MDSRITELTAILQKEEKVFQDYLGLLTQQQENLIKNDLSGIKSSIEKINELAQDAANLENGRRKVVSKLSQNLGMNPEDINISRILESLDGPKFDELESFKNKILEFHRKIASQKRRNQLLIDQSMNVINQTMQFIHEIGNPKATYDNPVMARGGAGSQGALISRMI
jgi:hypothetical protein